MASVLAFMRRAFTGWAALSGAALFAAVAGLFMSGSLGAAREEPAVHRAPAEPAPALQADTPAAHVMRPPLVP